MNRFSWMLAVCLSILTSGQALAEEPAKILATTKRLACAYSQGLSAVFTPQGRVSLKPPLDPNTPGLTIAVTDRAKNRAVLEEDALETPGVLMVSPAGLSVMARYADGGVTMVTVYPVHAGASDNLLMVSSRHGAGSEPQVSQRYGFCRPGQETPLPAEPPAPPPAKKSGH
ncbi:hypothetical protein [Solidesulfovibrio carbinolicus]|uniref:Uncharacterized protein n=1 Tax=Solidesulfovibrio carbinolicus TaxID=296842 RepID=A0A4P6HM16_9BACT|nr:hypothetical protein [Solidesulfovibrio carbinolicus]QAZ68211.1 hypothetical protein C3Y92_13660 [Solidesulfovibrio carbinolicus]